MSADDVTLATLRMIAAYQFGAGAGAALFSSPESLTIRRSKSDRPTQVIAPDGRLVTLGQDGRFTLGFAGGNRLHTALSAPACRVVVDDESEPFVLDGANVFAKFVEAVDEHIRPYDEVLVVHEEDDRLLGVGRASLAASAMEDFETGVAVATREGRDGWRETNAT